MKDQSNIRLKFSVYFCLRGRNEQTCTEVASVFFGGPVNVQYHRARQYVHRQKPYSQISTVYPFLIKSIRCLKGRMIIITVLIRPVMDQIRKIKDTVKDDSESAA